MRDKIQAAFERLRARGYVGVVDLDAAAKMSTDDLVLGLLGVVAAQDRQMAALRERVDAIERKARHK